MSESLARLALACGDQGTQVRPQGWGLASEEACVWLSTPSRPAPTARVRASGPLASSDHSERLRRTHMGAPRHHREMVPHAPTPPRTPDTSCARSRCRRACCRRTGPSASGRDTRLLLAALRCCPSLLAACRGLRPSAVALAALVGTFVPLSCAPSSAEAPTVKIGTAKGAEEEGTPAAGDRGRPQLPRVLVHELPLEHPLRPAAGEHHRPVPYDS